MTPLTVSIPWNDVLRPKKVSSSCLECNEKKQGKETMGASIKHSYSPSLALLAGDPSPFPKSSLGELEREEVLVLLNN